MIDLVRLALVGCGRCADSGIASNGESARL
jgi:hypothetical protein